MTDLEERLRTTLAREADSLDVGPGLAGDARRRHHARRTVRVGLGAAVTTVLIAVVVVTAQVVPVRHGPGPARTAGPVPSRTVQGWGLTLSVPDRWVGGGSNWCPTATACSVVTSVGVHLGSARGLAQVVEAARKQGASGPYLTPRELSGGSVWRFRARSAAAPGLPEGAWIGLGVRGGAGALVVSPSRATAQQVLDSLRADAARGWRTVRWSRYAIDVPPGWTPGATSGWCSTRRSLMASSPHVQLPTTAVPDVLCDPQQGYGVAIGHQQQAAGATDGQTVLYLWSEHPGRRHIHPDRSWVSVADLGGTGAIVVAPDERTARTVADSFRESG